MRQLSPPFLHDLKTGFLSALMQHAVADTDLDLEIRDSYVNLYYKGNSLLNLKQTKAGVYHADVHPKFATGLNFPTVLADEADTAQFLQCLPQLKQNVIRHGKHSLEVEYEQLIIRANNFEPRNVSDYFVVDRQYMLGRDRFDLVGFYWDRRGRRAGQTVPLCLFEVKFALNPDIAEVHEQLKRYYAAVAPRLSQLAAELQGVFRQKLELGLYRQEAKRLHAMRTLTFSADLSQVQFVLILIDYNPHSSLIKLPKLKQLPFANQIRIFQGGFALWQDNVPVLADWPK
jgi:hypothetical protein